MVTLAINTASATESLALFSKRKSKDKLLAETSWKGNRDETQKLLPQIMKLLKKARLKLNEVERIIVVRGPGPFSALRIGVTVANILAVTLNAELFSIDTKRLWELRAPDTRMPSIQMANISILLLHAGGDFVARGAGFIKGNKDIRGGTPGGTPDSPQEGIFHIEAALALSPKLAEKPLVFFGDLTENEFRQFKRFKKKCWSFIPEEKLKSFGQTILSAPAKAFKKENRLRGAAPEYWKPPNITKPHA